MSIWVITPKHCSSEKAKTFTTYLHYFLYCFIGPEKNNNLQSSLKNEYFPMKIISWFKKRRVKKMCEFSCELYSISGALA